MRAVSDRALVLRVKSKASKPHEVLISVEDCGTGIDPKDADRTFDTFFTQRHGNGSRDLPVDRRTSWWQPVGVTGRTARFCFSHRFAVWPMMQKIAEWDLVDSGIDHRP
jgi:hypothetical protein